MTIISLGQLGSSLAFGALWLAIGLTNAVTIFAVALLIALVVSTPLLMRHAAGAGG